MGNFSTQALQLRIMKYKGMEFSTNTLNKFDLIAEGYRFICNNQLGYDLKEIERCFAPCTPAFDATQPFDYNIECQYVQWDEDVPLGPVELWEELHDYFDSVSPAGYYFGSHPSNGSDIGWHPDYLLGNE